MFRVKKLKANVERALKDVRDELNDHLTAINENTNEIQSNYSELGVIETRIDKLYERLDEIQLLLNTILGENIPPISEYNIQDLSIKEKELYQAISAIQDEKGKATYYEIAKRCSISTTLSMGYIASLIQKGVPIIKKFINNVAYISIDERFREYQIQTNIIEVCESINRKVSK